MAKAPEKQTEPVTATVTALTPIHHDGVAYQVGDSITMTPEQAVALIDLKAAEAADAPAA